MSTQPKKVTKAQKKVLAKSSAAPPNRRRRRQIADPKTIVPKAAQKVVQATAPANAVVKLVGGHGKDPLSQKNQATIGNIQNFAVQGISTQLDVVATISDRTLPLAAMGLCLYAIRNGWMSNIKSGEHPFFAFQYVCDVLKQVIDGDTPVVQNAPKALWDFIAAIKPKAASFKTAKVKYDWMIAEAGLGIDPKFELGSSASPYYVFWGTMSQTLSYNGFMVLVPPSASYTQALGAESFQSMCSFLQQGPMAKMMGDATATSALLSDTSAFAVCYPEIGYTAASEGGAATTIYSERQIAVPLLSKLAKYQPDGQYYRGWIHASKSAGTPCYILPKMLEMEKAGQLYNKASPVFKFFNFDEIFFVLSTTLGLALQNFYANTTSTGVETCPLTSQEVQILLRQSVLSIMSNHLAQDLVLGNFFTPIAPFVVGPNGVSLDQANMLLPTVLCENIRAMCRKELQLSDEYKEYIADYIPILSRPQTQPPLGNFEVLIDNVPFILYRTDSTEVPMNLIDCSVQDGSNTYFLSMNGSKFSSNLAKWVSWITKLSGCLSPLTTVGAEPGITALGTVFFTNTQQDVPVIPNVSPITPVLQKQNSQSMLTVNPNIKLTPAPSKTQRTTRLPQVAIKNKGIAIDTTLTEIPTPSAPTYLQNWTEKEIFLNQSPAAPVFKVIRDLILPCHLSFGQGQQASMQAWQSFMVEPFKVAKSEAGGTGGDFEGVFPQIQSRLQRLASYDAKTLASGNQQNEFVRDLLTIGAQGRGGFFAQIAGALAGSIIPGLGSVVQNAVSSFGG